MSPFWGQIHQSQRFNEIEAKRQADNKALAHSIEVRELIFVEFAKKLGIDSEKIKKLIQSDKYVSPHRR